MTKAVGRIGHSYNLSPNLRVGANGPQLAIKQRFADVLPKTDLTLNSTGNKSGSSTSVALALAVFAAASIVATVPNPDSIQRRRFAFIASNPRPMSKAKRVWNRDQVSSHGL